MLTIHFDLLEYSPEFQRALFDVSLEHGPMVIGLPSGQKVQVLDGKQSLIPTSEPVAGLDTGEPLHVVRFGLINFPDFMKPRFTESQTDAETPWSIEELRTIHLESDLWLVEIRPVGNRTQVYESLKEQRGFALTHWVKATRIDGKPFPNKSVQPFMATLNQFLSFARGVSCGMTLIKGLDEAGETVWEEWGVTKVQPWKGHRSCLDIRNGATLEDLFVGFWCYSRVLPQDSQTYPALEWYLESNAQEASHTSIVLKPLSQIQRSTLWPLQDANQTPSLGGFGVKLSQLVRRRLAGLGFVLEPRLDRLKVHAEVCQDPSANAPGLAEEGEEDVLRLYFIVPEPSRL